METSGHSRSTGKKKHEGMDPSSQAAANGFIAPQNLNLNNNPTEDEGSWGARARVCLVHGLLPVWTVRGKRICRLFSPFKSRTENTNLEEGELGLFKRI